MRTNSLNKTIILIVLVLSSFIVFFCLNESSLAIEGALLFAIMLASKMSKKTIVFIGPTLLITLYLVVALAASGRLMERDDYNIPWKFVVKFLNLLFAMMAGYGMTSLSKDRKRQVVIAGMVSLTISSIVSIFFVLFVHREAIRFGRDLGITGTFTFDQMYGAVVLAPGLLMFCLKSVKLVRRRILLVLCALSVFACILLSALTTALLLALMGVALGFVMDALDIKNPKKLMFWGIVVFLLFVLLMFRQQIGELLFGLTKNMSDYVKYRLQRVIDMVFSTNHANAYTMDRRMELADYSLETFRKNPLFGCGIGEIRYGVIGYHQEWPDMLGVCGIVGTAVIIISLFIATRTIYRKCEQKIDRQSMVLGIVLFLALGFLNPCLVFPELFGIFVILPNLSSLCTKAAKSEHNDV